MVGIVALEARKGRRPALEEGAVWGMPALWAGVPAPPGLREARLRRRTERAAAALARAGVRRVLAAEDFPCWPVLEAAGLRPVETEPFCQAMAVPLALAALRRARILRAQATVALAGQRVSRPLFAAAEALCPQVRRLVVDVPGEGEELAAWLREEYGAAVLPPGTAADVTACFGPAGGESGGAALHAPDAVIAGGGNAAAGAGPAAAAGPAVGVRPPASGADPDFPRVTAKN